MKTNIQGQNEQGGGERPAKRARASPSVLGQLAVGCAGFGQKSWCGPLYPPGTKPEGLLDAYQARFRWVEVNNTAYRVPSASQVAAWRSKCAKGFTMTLKVPAAVTHEHGLREEGHAALQAFVTAAKGLGPYLGPLLLQLPRTVASDVELLKGVGPWLRGLRVAFEPRNESWFHDEVCLALLREWDWALVCHPSSVGRATVGTQSTGRDGDSQRYPLEALHTVTTGSWMYVRLHGDNDEHTYNYSSDELAPYATQVHEWRQKGLDVYVAIISGGPDAVMAHNALEILQQICRLANEELPKGPKQVRSISSFFTRASGESKSTST